VIFAESTPVNIQLIKELGSGKSAYSQFLGRGGPEEYKSHFSPGKGKKWQKPVYINEKKH